MSVWIGGATLLIGTGLTVAGNAQQRVANNKANDLNQQNIEAANKLEWQKYLMGRGINGGTNVAPGEMPTNGTIVNTKLPLYAQVRGGKFSAAMPRAPLGGGSAPAGGGNYTRSIAGLGYGGSSGGGGGGGGGISMPANYDWNADAARAYGVAQIPGEPPLRTAEVIQQ